LGLSFVDPDMLEFVLIVAFILLRNREFRVILPLFAFTRLFSVVLKGIFAIPLPDGVVPSYGFLGYSFPSGHVHISSVFYAWMIFSRNCLFVKFFSTFALFIGMVSEVIAGFHRVIDVGFAPFIAWLKCWITFKIRLSETSKLVLISGASILIVGSMFALGMKRYTDGNPYTYETLYKILGFCACHICLTKFGFRAVAIIPMMTLGMVSIFAQLNEHVYINQLKWIFISALLPITNYVVTSLMSRIRFSKNKSSDGISFSVSFTKIRF
jgi:undecaprenyl-diphosphatase